MQFMLENGSQPRCVERPPVERSNGALAALHTIVMRGISAPAARDEPVDDRQGVRVKPACRRDVLACSGIAQLDSFLRELLADLRQEARDYLLPPVRLPYPDLDHKAGPGALDLGDVDLGIEGVEVGLAAEP